MRPNLRFPRRAWVIIAALIAATAPVVLHAAPREDTLAGVRVGSDFLDVLNRRGAPHYIGPALSGVEAVEIILNPPPMLEMSMLGAPAAGPPAPGAPFMQGGGPMAPQKPEEEYSIWLYEGDGNAPNESAGWNTYVFLNKYGAVVGVVAALTNLSARPNVRVAGTGVTFGTRLMEIVDKYDWPQPFARVGSHYFMSYPASNITFGLDTAKRRLAVIAIGLPVTVVFSEQKGGPTGVGGPPTGAPLPGGSTLPY